MTLDEAEALAQVIGAAQPDQRTVQALCQGLNAAFPQFVWSPLGFEFSEDESPQFTQPSSALEGALIGVTPR